MEERLVDVVSALVAHRKPAILAQPSQRTLHHPPVPSQLLARVDPTAGDACLYAPLPQGLAAAGEVVGFVGMQLLGALARLDAIHGLFQNLRVMDVGGAEDYREREASSVCHNMALRARLSLIRRIRAGSSAPLFAGTLAESKEALSQSIRSASPKRSKSTRWSSSHTPASCQSRNLRQQVDPDPQPISFGSISQGMLLFKTKTMPARAARSSMRGLPPLGFGGSSGNRGSMISQSSSDTNSLLMTTSVTSTHKQVLQDSLSCFVPRRGLDSLRMRDFQGYTKERQGTRRLRWWMWSLPVVLVALFVGIELVAGPVSIERLTSASPPDSGRVEASPSDWVERMFGGQPGLTDGPLNVLVLGVDTRPDSEEMGSRTDTIMLVQVVPKTGDVKLLSVPRDLLVEVEPGERGKINAAYNYGGVDETIDALENYSGVPVDHYAVVDFEGFERVIDAMGGVRFELKEGEFTEKWRMGQDVQRLNGHKALIFARYRGTPGADLDRMKRQRELVGALRSEGLRWHTVKTLPQIMEVMDENIRTDLDVDGAITLGQILIRKGRHAEMTSQQLQGTPETLPNGEQVLIPDEDANQAILDEFRH